MAAHSTLQALKNFHSRCIIEGQDLLTSNFVLLGPGRLMAGPMKADYVGESSNMVFMHCHVLLCDENNYDEQCTQVSCVSWMPVVSSSQGRR